LLDTWSGDLHSSRTFERCRVRCNTSSQSTLVGGSYSPAPLLLTVQCPSRAFVGLENTGPRLHSNRTCSLSDHSQ